MDPARNLARFSGKTGWLLAVSGVFVGTILSPVLLLGIDHLFHANWVTVSNIGQTYGFASAILSGLALLAVAYSLIIQQRESTVARIENQRILHTELIKMAIEDPSLMGVVLVDPAENIEVKRRRLFTNLFIQSMRISYAHSGVLSADAVRSEIDYAFRGVAARLLEGKKATIHDCSCHTS